MPSPFRMNSFIVTETDRPIIIAYVKLDDGPTTLTSRVNVEAEKISIGMKVKPTWVGAQDGTQVVFFTPA